MYIINPNHTKNSLQIFLYNEFYIYFALFLLAITTFLCISKIYFSLKFEKNIDNFKDTKNYLYIYLCVLNISLIYLYFFNFKVKVFYFLFFINFFTTFFFVVSYIFIDPFKFSLSLSGFSQKKNWLKNTVD